MAAEERRAASNGRRPGDAGGDLTGAMALYQQSLSILFQRLGDLQGKGVTLTKMANIATRRDDWKQAAHCIFKSSILRIR